MLKIDILECCGQFAENKDIAKDIRENKLKPYFADNNNLPVILNFGGVTASTQSFIHALISGFFQREKEKALEMFDFQNCNNNIKTLITTVINYSLE